MIVIRESCVPPTANHQHKKIVRVGGFSKLADKPELRAANGFWDALFLPHRPPTPMDGPVACDIELRWPHTSNTNKKKAGSDLPMDKGVDLDNMAKTVVDALARCGFIVNDSRIVDLRLRKYRSPSPGIVVKIGLTEEAG